MSVRRKRLSWHGRDPTLTIVAEGPDDVYRLAHHLTTGQCEFAAIGFSVKKSLRRRWGREGWARVTQRFHGSGPR